MAACYYCNTEYQSVSCNYLPWCLSHIAAGEKRAAFSAYLAAGMEQNATAVQQANMKRYRIDKRYVFMNSPLHVSCQQINFKSISTGECHSLVPSPVKGRPPLTKATDGTGSDG